ncbi:DUF4258 domain-containing protein [candidate division KSB1 bacterium]|nr:DUF4258 domain-containing protein [candidate division KSB1 bacterium]
MSKHKEFIKIVRDVAKEKILYLPHAITQMNKPDRMISTEEIRFAIFNGEIIEDYPENARGHSCLILGWKDRPVHVICAPKDNYLTIITAYLPSLKKWKADYKIRKG